MRVWPGVPYPQGATWDGEGVNFSIFSEHAESVDLCLFDEEGEEHRIQMNKRTALNWHCYVPGVSPGQRYGFRVHGPYDPTAGLRCNPNKLLLDPYAKAIDGTFKWDQSLFGYDFGDEDSRNDEDSAASMPKSVVINPFFDWGTDRPPQHEYADSIIYEAHVKGLTETHPDIPERSRGTYAAIAHPAIIEHLVETFKALEQEGLAILLIEQNLGVATSLAERQLVMVAGSIFAETTATDLAEDAELQRRFLGVEPLAERA